MRRGIMVLATVFAAAWATPSPATVIKNLITLTAEASQDNLGCSVAAAGDVNGDGYPDVIVGAIGNDAGGVDAGRAYVLFGGPGADDVPDLVLTGEAAGDLFGCSVAGPGDLNGDGYADVIVGAYRNDAAGADAGRAYIYFGGKSPDSSPDLVLPGHAAGDQFGYRVAAAGDVNGDGFPDVIVGAPYEDFDGLNSGSAFVYFGGTSMNPYYDARLDGPATNSRFGSSVGTAGDMNGDGFPDLIVGADYPPEGGRAYVYFGAPSLSVYPDLKLRGGGGQDYTEISVGTAGDVNGDGYADAIVGIPLDSAGGLNAGRAFVYYGGAIPDTVADLTMMGNEEGALLGHSLGAAGDINGDGFGDFIVGVYRGSAGLAHVYYGGSSPNDDPDVLLKSPLAFESHFGSSLATAGDFDGDGYPEVVVGATDLLTGGKAYVLRISPCVLLSPNGGEQWVVGEPGTVRWLGSDIVDIELSIDGGLTYATLVRGVGGADENELTLVVPSAATEHAKIRIVYTGQAADRTNSDATDATLRIVAPTSPKPVAARARISAYGAAPSDGLGVSVAPAGDVNGDGYPDWIAGAWYRNAGAGAASVYFGGPGADDVPDWTLTSAVAGENLGKSVSTAGDVNGDGYADVIVGAPGNGTMGVDAGAAYVFYGGPVPDGNPDLVFTGAAAGDFFGNSVAGAGDVNGDGYADLIVGASQNDQGGVDAGRAYVFFGGPSADNVPDLVLTGAAAGDCFGGVVASAGDINGDGFGDIAVGAWGDDAGGIDAGRAYVYFGGSAADDVPDLVLTGAAAGDGFGGVASAGDVNGDGFGDIFVAAGGNDAGGSNAGRAYVYYGGPLMDSAPDLVLTGAAANEHFGTGGSAGDVNGDGFGDLIVGAWGSHAGGTRAGRAYVYYGGASPDAIADIIMNGAAAEDFFGISVGAAGDIDGDGFTDLIVGANGSDAGGTNAGAAYLCDVKRYHVLSPNGGETWNVGASKTISWLGAEPASVWLSTDAGKSYDLLASDVGGAERNDWALRVPHAPGKFSMVKIAPTDPSLRGFDRSDSMFTIQTSVSLLALLAAPAPDRLGAAVITWSTDPGPADLAGYKLEKGSTIGGWRTLVTLTKETTYTDESAALGASYRLFAVNGLGEELWLGETSVRPVRPLAAWPLPYRGGDLNVSFATYGGLGGGPGRTEVSVYDVRGRLVRRLAQGAYAAGYQVAVWDGKDERGARVAAGVYLLRVQSEAGSNRTIKLAVLR